MIENLDILATIGSALTVYFCLRRASKKETQELKVEMKTIQSSISSIDQRLSRLEGRFEERGYWESRQYHQTGTEEK